jgi:hypothetical protein
MDFNKLGDKFIYKKMPNRFIWYFHLRNKLTIEPERLEKKETMNNDFLFG